MRKRGFIRPIGVVLFCIDLVFVFLSISLYPSWNSFTIGPICLLVFAVALITLYTNKDIASWLEKESLPPKNPGK